MTYKYERNECQGCTRICYCIVWIDELTKPSILCNSCFTAMKEAPDMKIVIKRIFDRHGIPQLEAE